MADNSTAPNRPSSNALLGGVGLPGDTNTAFPDLRSRAGRADFPFAATAALVGPSNQTDNPGVSVFDRRMILGDGEKMGHISTENDKAGPVPQNETPISVDGLITGVPGMDSRPPLVPGLVPTQELPHNNAGSYGLGTR